MRIIVPVLLLCTVLTEASTQLNATELGQIKISNYAHAIVEHYKQKDPVGLPIQGIPDPMEAPDIKAAVPSVDKLLLRNIKMHGLSKFRIDYVHVDMAEMKAELSITIDKLDMFGNYTLGSFIGSSTGPFTIKAKKVNTKASARLEVNEFGKLEAQEITMDFAFGDIDIKFEKLSFLFSIFQNVINTMPGAIFDSVKPYVLKQFQTVARSEINKEATKVPILFPNSITPIDQIVAQIRRALRERSCDPFKIKDYNKTVGLMAVELTNTWLTGITSIHRVGNVSFTIKNNTLHGNIQIGTQKLEGSTHWEVGFVAGILSRTGTIVFSVDYIRVEIAIKQSLDTRNKPTLEDLQLELGNIQIRFDGAGTLDYVIEFAINILPNVLRYQLMDGLESPLKIRIQEQLNLINVENILLDTADKYDNGEFDDIIKETSGSDICPLSQFTLE